MAIQRNIVQIPALVDLHVHFREPGFSYKETILTGSMAAAASGYGAVFAMPNLNPAPDTIEHLQEQLDIIHRDAYTGVYPYASITIGQKGAGQLVDFEALAPHVKGFSDDGRGIQDTTPFILIFSRMALLSSGIAVTRVSVRSIPSAHSSPSTSISM